VDDFNGKVVVVTGAASGIGREIALAFARRGAGLSLCDIDGEGLSRVRDGLKFGYSPEKVADSVLRAAEKNKVVVSVDKGMHMMDLTHRLSRRLVGSQVKHLVRMMDRWL